MINDVKFGQLPLADQIAAAIELAHFPSVLMMLVHLTGDTGVLTEARQAKSTDFLDPGSGIDPQEELAARTMARDALMAHLVGGAPLPPPPGAAELRRMMDFLAGAEIPESYLGFLEEELGLTGDARHPTWTIEQLPGAKRDDFQVVIVGAGMSGLLMAIRLKQAGIRFQVIEKNADIGGTWLENTYPGCRVDSNNQIYAYSFEPNPVWPQRFSTQPDILAYFRDVADRHQLRDAISFNTTMTAARFRPDTNDWCVEIECDGERGEIVANVVVSAVGQLNMPLVPEIPDASRFAGPAFHSARWRHDIDLAGKRVAVIGSGASAFQFVPEIAPKVEQLLLFQRTPPWLMPTPEYHEDVPAAEKWLLRHGPFYAKWYRFWQFWLFVDGLHGAAIVDPDYASDGGSVSAPNEQLRGMFVGWIEQQAADRPELLPDLVPQYPALGKRALRDNGAWIGALKSPNVTIERSAITGIYEQGIETADGHRHEVDAIIYGTGFRANDLLGAVDVTGHDGTTLAHAWQGDARAYLGMTIPNFPNFFCLYGPNTNLVANGSIIFFTECSVNYVMQALHWLLDSGADAIDVKPEVYNAYNEEVDRANALRAWGYPGVSNWYKSASGRVSQNWPFPTARYWEMTKTFERDEFTVLAPQNRADPATFNRRATA